MKKLTALLMAVVLLFSLTVPALAAPVQATSFLLEKTEGTVSVTSGSGKNMPKKSGMHLYNGYSVATEKKSYAYISLDRSKVIKLDASSQTQVEASGKKLELNVTEGSMFFDVSEPLTSKETLTIRTSTMVTGIRGTCGWVSVIDRYTTRISLLEGQLAITSIDPLTGLPRTTVIVGGQTATIVFRGMGSDVTIGGETGGSTAGGSIGGGTGSSPVGGIGGGNTGSGTVGGSATGGIPENQIIQDLIEVGTIRDEHIILTGTGLTVESLQEEDVPGFVAVEVKKNPALQERIEKNSPLSVPAIIGDAENRLAQDEAAAEEADKAIQDAVDHLQVEEVDPVFGQSASGEAAGGGASGGGGTSGGGTNDPSGGGTTTYYALTVKHQTADGAPIPNIMDEVTQFAANTSYNAVPQVITGYTYTGSSGDAMSGTMDGNKTVIFIYELTGNTPALEYSLTIICEDESGDLVGDTDVQILAEGTAYDVSNPPPISGYQYVGVKNGSDPLTGTMNSNKTITFVYTPTGTGDDTTSTPTNYTLTVNSKTISYNVTAGAMGEATNPATIIENANNPQTITAPAGHIIASIEGDGIVFSLSNDRTTASITMDSDKEITATYLSTTVNMTSPSTAQLRNVTAYYTEYSALYSIPSDVKITLNITGDISLNTPSSVTIPANFIVNLSGATSLASNATLDTAEGTQLNVTSGTFTNNGTISGQGTMNVAAGATVSNNGDILVEHNESMHISGIVNNYGTVKVGTANRPGKLVIETSGILTNADTAQLTVESGSTLLVGGTVTTANTINNSGIMTVTGSVTGAGFSADVTPTIIDNSGDLTLEGGTVNLQSETGSAILSMSGTVTVKNGSVSGAQYGIRSGADGDGSISIIGGTVNGDTAVYVSAGSTMELTGGTVSGISCGIANAGDSADNVTMNGGTVYVSGTNVQTTQIIDGNITFNSGTLEADIDVFTGSSAEENLELPQCTYNQTTGKYTIVREDASARTFTEFATNTELAAALKLDYVKTVNLMAGGELTDTTAATALASGKTLNVKGDTLTVAEGAELAVSGKVEVSKNAGITCVGILSSTTDSTIINNGSILIHNVANLSDFNSETFYAEIQEKAKLNGSFTNSSTGILSIGEIDKTDTIDAASKYGYLALKNTTNDGIISVACNSRLNVQSGTLTNNKTITLGQYFDSVNIDSYFGLLTVSSSTLTNNSSITGGEINISSGSLTNAANGELHIEGLNSRLAVSSGGSLANLGKFYVGDRSQVSFESSTSTFTNSGELFMASNFTSSGTFVNTLGGTVWVGYVGEDTEGTNTLLPGYLTNARTLENLGQIYVAPGSKFSNRMMLYNAGRIDLGASSELAEERYPNVDLSECDDAILLNGEGNVSGSLYNGRTADNNTASGTMNLYSGQLYNYSNSYFVNADADTNGNDGGSIHVYPDATFRNGNQFNPAESGTFYLEGIFDDTYDRVALYAMVLDSSHQVMAYKSAATLFTAGDENTDSFAWTDNYTYRLISCGGPANYNQTLNLPAVTADNVTLDLGGYALILESPLQVGEAIDAINEETGEAMYTSGATPGSLTLANTRLDGTVGSITVENSQGNAAYGAFNSHVIKVVAGNFNMTGGTVKMANLTYAETYVDFYNPFTPIYVAPCAIYDSFDDETPTFASTTVYLDGCEVINEGSCSYGGGIYVSKGSASDASTTQNCSITITGGSTITSEGVGIDLYGSDIEVTIKDGSTLTSPSNGISISAANTTINVDGAGTKISAGYAGIINNSEGNSGGVEINVTNGAKVSATNTTGDSYGIAASNAAVTISDGIVSASLEEIPDGDGGSNGCGYGITLGGNGTLTISGSESSVSGYYAVSAESGDSGNPTITINGGTVTGSGGDGLSVSNGTVTMNAGTVSGGSNGIQIQDSSNSDNPNLVTLNITGGTISTAATGDFSTLTGYGILYTYESVKPKFTVGNTPFSPSGNDTWYTYPSTTFTDGATITGGTAAIGICPLGG